MSTSAAKFQELFGHPPQFVVRAPGRVNLIGEHTDYNDGYVFPAAIDFFVTMAGSARSDRQVRAYSITYNQSTTFSLDDIQRSTDAPWSNYVRGVAATLQDEGFELRGANLLVEGTVPIGSGLSSSAAMEVASCLSFEAAGGFEVEPVKRALVCLRSEREFVGLQCGIMDQFICALGRRDHALLIDTRSLEYEAVPLPASGVSILISNTNKPRELVGSAYNERKAECEEAVRILSEGNPAIKALRDAGIEEVERGEMTDTIRKRARHVVAENSRVLESVVALKSANITEFGRLMNASHDSLRDDYEVSCAELDVLVEAARSVDGVYGSRMTGAGFGGCTVSLVADEAVEEFKAKVGAEYRTKAGLRADFFVCRATDGARRVL